MAWKCPDCGVQHEDVSPECSCGYSLYKILGIKPGASAEEVKQAYKYLLKVWQEDRSGQDPLSKKKAEDRLKKINEAYEIFRKNIPESSADAKKSSFVKIAASAAAVFILLLGVLALSISVFQGDKARGPQPQKKQDEANLPAPPAGQVKTEHATGTSSHEISRAPVQPGTELSSEVPGEITEEEAIELVKKSHALYRNTSTESLIKKWTEENSGNYKIIGWQAKKMDEERYLVSYTAMDGALPKGFYFDLDIKTGVVENLESKPELQKKYNIKYGQ
jgi:hypothetical protein